MMQKRDKAQNDKAGKPEATPGPQPGPKTTTKRETTPSEKLAVLLRRESLLVARAKKAQADLKAVQHEISAAWGEREKVNRELLDEGLEA
jgi:hypothetical protein